MFILFAIHGEMALSDIVFQRLLNALPSLLPAQLAELAAAVKARIASVSASALAPAQAPRLEPLVADPRALAPIAGSTIAMIEARFAGTPQCPHCTSASIKKWGSANALKRYRCKACKATFNALTSTPLARLHRRELWGRYAGALLEGISPRKVAARLDIDLTTSFRWRHRFLEAIKSMQPKTLKGTVEADETYFLHSKKGSRDLGRPARKRGGKASKRGLSDQQVPVLIARDRDKATADRILDDRSEASIAGMLGSLVSDGSALVSDGAQAYRAFAAKAHIPHVGLALSKGERSWGIYHVQNVNAYTSQLKRWMRRFNGVATKYLDSYLGWHRMNNREGNTLTAKRIFIAAMG